MRSIPVLATIVAAVLCSFSTGAETEKKNSSRETPIVKAVKKTQPAAVCIKATKKGKESTGSGVVFDPRGFVLTNWHVVAGCDKIVIHFADQSKLDATVYKEIQSNDLAVLEVTPEKRLPYLELGNGDDLMPGEDVIVLGNPYGYQHSVSTGIVSSLGRDIDMPHGEKLCNLIQTSASINPGNSGGPMLNINGELIGIVVAVRDGANGIAFAINIETVKEVLSEAMSARKVSGLHHGLLCADREEKAVRKVVVNDVAVGSPAAVAGLQNGDEIKKVNNIEIVNRFDVERAMWGRKVGDKVNITLSRGGETKFLPLVLSGGAEAVTASK